MQQEQLYDNIFNNDDISWQAMIFEAVKSEEMSPWDVDIAAIQERFMKMLSGLKDMNFKIPGKVILASAMLLKFKSYQFVHNDVAALDALIASTQDSQEHLEYEGEDEDYEAIDESQGFDAPPELTPRTPQPRKRKVSVYDLVKALEKAIEVKNRRKVLVQRPDQKVELPNKVFDLSVVMSDVFGRVVDKHESLSGDNVMFSHIAESQKKEDKVYAFIPLLHLTNMRKIDLHQDEHFGDFKIELLTDQKSIAQEVEQQANE